MISNINHLTTNATLSFSDVDSNGYLDFNMKNALVKSVDIDMGCTDSYTLIGSRETFHTAPSPVTVTIELVIRPEDYSETFGEDRPKPKIKNKRIEDCSISELLYAIRSKNKERK